MDVRIGVTYSPKELTLELPDDVEHDDLRSQVEGALGSDGAGMLWLTDRKGRQVGVPAEKIAYVELGATGEKGRIGFGST